MSGSDQRTDGTDNRASEGTAEQSEGVSSSIPSSGAGKSRDPRVILDEMLDSIDLIQRYTKGLTFEEFAAQRVLQDAVVLRIAILGEAASHLLDEDKEHWANVPWRVVTDMRNRLIHGYFAVRLDLVWQVVAVDPRSLKSQLRGIRDSLA